MRILVTGGAGFIGSHIADLALQGGHEVAVLDNLSSGSRANVPGGAALHVADLRDPGAVRAVVEGFRPDVVNHQAAQASVSVSVRDPLLDAETNVLGTLHLLEACREFGVRRVVFASTGGAIYGDIPEGERADESRSPHPYSPYATSKLAGEIYLATYRAQYGLDYSVLRYANVYGPRQNPHGEAGVVAIFSERALAGEALRVHGMHAPGDGGCVRDYVYVGDVARANLRASLGELPVQLLNIGTGQPTTTAELAAQLTRVSGRSVPIHDAPPRPGDVARSLLDPTAYRAHFGEPTALGEGLAQTVAWFAQQPAEQR